MPAYVAGRVKRWRHHPRNTSLSTPSLVAAAGSEKRYRDWKNGATGTEYHQTFEESADTFFYQVACDMGTIARQNGWVSSAMVTIPELIRRRAPWWAMPTREWKQKRFKNRGIRKIC